jgi:hypothetical protein
MSQVLSSLLVFFLMLAATGVGMFVNAKISERHWTTESVSLIQLAISLQVTFTAIVLGLLTSSVKTGFDAAYLSRGIYAGQIAQLDRCLRNYGPETAPARAQLRDYVVAVIASTWPGEPLPPGVAYPTSAAHMARTGEDHQLADVMNEVGLEVRALDPADALHRGIAGACAADYADVVRSRWVVIEGLHGEVSTPFYLVLVFWLAIVFGCFGLRAPPNRLNVVVIVMCALSVSTAIFVIQSLDVPYGSLFGVPSESMRNALADMMR